MMGRRGNGRGNEEGSQADSDRWLEEEGKRSRRRRKKEKWPLRKEEEEEGGNCTVKII